MKNEYNEKGNAVSSGKTTIGNGILIPHSLYYVYILYIMCILNPWTYKPSVSTGGRFHVISQ